VDLSIARLGSYAARVFRSAQEGRVAAVFQRSMHIEAGGSMLCVGEPSIGNGPLNAIVSAFPGTEWLSHAGKPGDAVAIKGRVLRVGVLSLDARRAVTWMPSPWRSIWTKEDLLRGLTCVLDIARRRAPDDGLAKLALGTGQSGEATALERIAAPRLRELAAWLRAAVARDASAEVTSGVTLLVGLGPGLTPSGDDLLCGATIALHGAGRREAALKLAAAVGAVTAERTTLLSRDFLRAAADGQGSELLHDAIEAILAGDVLELPSLVDALGRVGHTSGWDALAGAMMALSAYAEAVRPTKSP